LTRLIDRLERDGLVGFRAEDDQRALDGDLRDDRDRVELRAAHRIEGVAKQVCVRGGDQQRRAGDDQRCQPSAKAEGNREDNAGRTGKRQLEDQQRPQVVAELVRCACRLACVQRVEAEVGDHRHQRQVGDQGRVAPVADVAKPVGEVDDDDQRDQARDHAGAENEDSVADSARAEPCCSAGSFVAHGDNPRGGALADCIRRTLVDGVGRRPILRTLLEPRIHDL